MLPLSRLNNDLQLRDERDNLDRIRRQWQKIVAADINFPALTGEEISGLAILVYQAMSYVQKHLNENSEFEVMVNQFDPHLMCAKFQSCLVSSKSYLLWIMFDEFQVISWYCRLDQELLACVRILHLYFGTWHLAQPFTHFTDWTQHSQDAKYFSQPTEINESNIFWIFFLNSGYLHDNE